jgi:hypothetical protein
MHDLLDTYQVFGIANVALFDSPRGKLQLQPLISPDFLTGCIGFFFVASIKNIFRNEIYPISFSGTSDCSYFEFVFI